MFNHVVMRFLPEQFDEIIKSDTARYSKLLQDAGVVPK